MAKKEDRDITVALPSLVHRVGREQLEIIRQWASEYGCTLKRVRRSRNWQLIGEPYEIAQLFAECRARSPETLKFVINKISPVLALHQDKLESVEDKLRRLIKENRSMTLAELCENTGCSIGEARRARFELGDED